MLRYLDSAGEIFYLGHDIRIIIEIPQGFFDFKKKFKILTIILLKMITFFNKNNYLKNELILL